MHRSNNHSLGTSFSYKERGCKLPLSSSMHSAACFGVCNHQPSPEEAFLLFVSIQFYKQVTEKRLKACSSCERVCNFPPTSAIWASNEKQLVLPGAAGMGTRCCRTPGTPAILPATRHIPSHHPAKANLPEAGTDIPVAKSQDHVLQNRRQQRQGIAGTLIETACTLIVRFVLSSSC